MKAVATDEVYWATENGQIFDCDYKNMNVFRTSTLYRLLSIVPSTIGRMGRPNNIVERHRRRGSRSVSITGRSHLGRAEGSQLLNESQDSDRKRQQRRGTINLVKNFMFSKIQRAQQSNIDGSMQDGASEMGALRAF